MSHSALRRLTSALVAISLCTLSLSAFAQTNDRLISSGQKSDILQGISTILEKDAFVPNVNFDEWNKFIAEQQTSIDHATTYTQFEAAVQKALNDFGFSHIYVMSPDLAEARLDHHVVGIGIQFQPKPDGILVVKVFPGSPAQKAKLEPGDEIISVEGKKVDNGVAMKGEAGTTVHFLVRHQDGKKQAFSLVREPFNSAEPDTLGWIDPQTALLTIPAFDQSYQTSTIESLFTQLESKKAQNLVIDLRGNPGGEVINFIHLLSMLVPADAPIGSMIGPNDVKQFQLKHPGEVDVVKVAATIPDARRIHVFANPYVPRFTGKVAVLVDGGSGSASEMVAAALRDTDDATIVGTKSAGAVLVSVIHGLPDGFQLQYPIRDYVTIGGVRLEGNGVTPDVIVKDPTTEQIDPKKDPVIKTATALLEKMTQQESVH